MLVLKTGPLKGVSEEVMRNPFNWPNLVGSRKTDWINSLMVLVPTTIVAGEMN